MSQTNCDNSSILEQPIQVETVISSNYCKFDNTKERIVTLLSCLDNFEVIIDKDDINE